MDLIKVRNDKTVCARELHEFLGISTRYDTWFNRRVEEYGFTSGVDFFMLKNEHNDIKELRMTIDMAKELCMVERNEKGRTARKYFIEVEKKWRESSKPATSLEILQGAVNTLVEQEKRLALMEDRQALVEAKVKLLSSDSQYRTVRGLANIMGIRNIPRNEASRIGKKVSAICRRENFVIGKVPDERDGIVHSYPMHILEPAIIAWQSGVL